jgi:pyruvate dehydrogenase E2 component (dihydrolipoamide acetyltransferase)
VLLRILVPEGTELAVGKAVCIIGEPGEVVAPEPAGSDGKVEEAAPPPPAPEPELVAPPPLALVAVEAGEERVKASPLARKMAKERGIDLAAVAGTGPDGRVVAEDVERAASAPAAGGPAPAVEAPPAAEGEVVKLTSVRRTIARRLSEAWQAPHFALSMSADMRRVIELRETLVERAPEGTAKPTYSDVITKLCAVALLRHPAVNAHYEGSEIRLFDSAHIGMAVAIPNGLVVPVLRNVETRSIPELAADRVDIVARTREGKLQPQDLEGGTFTISNLGMYGVERFFAVLNPPQVAILAVAAIEDRVVAEAGEIAIRPCMDLTMSCDHRGLDGATAAEFLRDLKSLLEEPGLAL